MHDTYTGIPQGAKHTALWSSVEGGKGGGGLNRYQSSHWDGGTQRTSGINLQHQKVSFMKEKQATLRCEV
jgi:hypothetical protein